MGLIRLLLQLVFGLLAAFAVVAYFWGSGLDRTSLLSGLAIFVFIILLLGPLWPGSKQRSKLRLAAKNPMVNAYINFGGVLYGLYKLWEMHAHPDRELWFWEKRIFAIAGTPGVAAFWVAVVLACTLYGIVAYKQAHKA